METLLTSLTIVLSLMTAPAFAATYDLEKPHSQIMFSVQHKGLSFSLGKFLDFDGTFDFDATNVEASKVDVTVKTDSLEMNHDKWNTHLKSEDFLNVAEFPEMTFTGTSAQKIDENTGVLKGNLTLLGITKSVVLNVTFNGEKSDPMGNRHMTGFSAVGLIKRSDFGMDYGIPMIADDVKIMIEVEGIRQAEANE